MSFGRIDVHLLPSLFSDGAGPALEALAGGHPSLAPRDEETAVRLRALESPAPGTSVRARADLRVAGRGLVPTEVELFGARPAGRALLGLCFDGREATRLTLKDLEVAILSFAMRALGADEQGAVLAGADLGPVGAGLEHGPLATELSRLAAARADALELLLLAPETAEDFRPPADFHPEPRGPLVQYRR